ncbi:MAG: tetratricopeptide repeat protein [Kiritimatiellae bacterium]|nr:tetratricopeptide repeat protein [Kiritimatiellia bacterium]
MRTRKLLIPVCLAAATLTLFGPAVTYDFTGFDDTAQVLDNDLIRSLRPSAVARMFRSLSVTSYYPVRLLSLAVDFAIWHEKAQGYHLTNLLLHTGNVLLLFALILQIGHNPAGGSDTAARPRLAAGLGALFFAVHPVVVEPVAWVAGREELLTLFFVLLTLHMAIRAEAGGGTGAKAAAPPIGRGVRMAWRGAAALCCALACLSNVLGAVAPALVLILDLCLHPAPEARLLVRLRRSVRRSILLWLVALSAVAAKVIILSKVMDYSTFGAEMRLALPVRILTILNTYASNLKSLFWPVGLAPIHANTVAGSPLQLGVLAGAAAAIATLALLWRLRRQAEVLLGLLWFLAALAPSSQVVPHHIFRADRFVYMPLAGLATAVAFGIRPFLDRRGARRAVVGLCAALLAVLALTAGRQRRIWQDTDSLFARVLRVSPDSFLGYYSYARALYHKGAYEQAADYYRRGLAIKPDHPMGRYSLGRVLNRLGEQRGLQGDIRGAIKHFSEALDTYAADPETHRNLGIAFGKLGDIDRAIAHFSEAVRIYPAFVPAHVDLGTSLRLKGATAAALAHFSEALRLQPGHPKAQYLLETTLREEAGKTR